MFSKAVLMGAAVGPATPQESICAGFTAKATGFLESFMAGTIKPPCVFDLQFVDESNLEKQPSICLLMSDRPRTVGGPLDGTPELNVQLRAQLSRVAARFQASGDPFHFYVGGAKTHRVQSARPAVGDNVIVRRAGKSYDGEEGRIIRDDKDSKPYKLKLNENGKEAGYFRESEVALIIVQDTVALIRERAGLSETDAAAQLVLYDKANDAVFVSEAPEVNEETMLSFVEAYKAGKLRPPRVFDMKFSEQKGINDHPSLCVVLMGERPQPDLEHGIRASLAAVVSEFGDELRCFVTSKASAVRSTQSAKANFCVLDLLWDADAADDNDYYKAVLVLFDSKRGTLFERLVDILPKAYTCRLSLKPERDGHIRARIEPWAEKAFSSDVKLDIHGGVNVEIFASFLRDCRDGTMGPQRVHKLDSSIAHQPSLVVLMEASSPSEQAEMRATLAPIAGSNEEIRFFIGSSKGGDFGLRELMGLGTAEPSCPKMLLYDKPRSAIYLYSGGDAISADSIGAFISAFKAGSLSSCAVFNLCTPQSTAGHPQHAAGWGLVRQPSVCLLGFPRTGLEVQSTLAPLSRADLATEGVPFFWSSATSDSSHHASYEWLLSAAGLPSKHVLKSPLLVMVEPPPVLVNDESRQLKLAPGSCLFHCSTPQGDEETCGTEKEMDEGRVASSQCPSCVSSADSPSMCATPAAAAASEAQRRGAPRRRGLIDLVRIHIMCAMGAAWIRWWGRAITNLGRPRRPASIIARCALGPSRTQTSSRYTPKPRSARSPSCGAAAMTIRPRTVMMSWPPSWPR
jgi:hypothetical protein